MSKKPLKFDDVLVNKKEFHTFKTPIALNLVDMDKIVIFDKCKHSDLGVKYFIGYTDYIIIRPLGIILPQMTRYIKYSVNNGKNMYVFYN